MSTNEPQLVATIRRLSERLYDTSVPMAVLDGEVTPYLDANVTFTDPWQHGSGIERYRLGLAGFHSMFRFTLEIKQVNVTVDPERASGRAIVDAVMHLKPVSRRLLPEHPAKGELAAKDVTTFGGALAVPVRQAECSRLSPHEEDTTKGRVDCGRDRRVEFARIGTSDARSASHR